MVQLNCHSNCLLHNLELLLHATGSDVQNIFLQQTMYDMCFLHEIGDEVDHEIDCAKEAMQLLLVLWWIHVDDGFDFLWAGFDSLLGYYPPKVLSQLLLDGTFFGVEFESCFLCLCHHLKQMKIIPFFTRSLNLYIISIKAASLVQ